MDLDRLRVDAAFRWGWIPPISWYDRDSCDVLDRVKSYSSSCFGPENSSCEMYPFLSLSSCWKISSTSLSCSAIMFLMSSDSWPPSAATICFFRYSLTSSRLSCMSLFSSISLNTLVVGGESPMLISSTSKTRVAPPGMTFPAPRSP
uniref:Uncharacterized protein n=1 Tax=Anopheles farauti TaxID=69004 RepID=A0A182QWQ6_9DIPT